MFPSYHLLSGILLAIGLFPYFGVYSIIILLATYFIDVDHYFWYVTRKKDFSLKNAYHYHLNDGLKDVLHIFHTFEFWIILAILSTLHMFFLAISIGVYFHIFLDFVDMNVFMKYGRRAISFVMWIARH